MITGHVWPFDTVDNGERMIGYPNNIGNFVPGNTYLHAGASKAGWPADHSAEDAFDLPPLPIIRCECPDCTAQSATPQEVAALKVEQDLRALAAKQMQEAEANSVSERQAADAFFNSKVFTPERMASQVSEDYEYRAESTGLGAARLVRVTITTSKQPIASFDKLEDAQIAAQALNESCGF